MDGREIEARMLMWAVAEISREDASGQHCQASAVLEDRSTSGACVRLTRPLAVGSVVTIRWQREQFSAVARNCRRDGREFLIGVRREAESGRASRNLAFRKLAPAATAKVPQLPPAPPQNDHPLLMALQAERERRRDQQKVTPTESINIAPAPFAPKIPIPNRAATDVQSESTQSGARSSSTGSPPRERKGMQPKTLFPKFWHRAKGSDQPESVGTKEMLVNKSNGSTADTCSADRHEMLSYEDIYHAAGIMKPASGYGIHKVVEMLNSERIRDLSKEFKRASILMALDAAGTRLDDVLADATRRQDALNRYEAGKKKQLEEFESAKAREIKEVEEEMERVRAHYAERIERNHDLVAQEKEGLRNWQMAMQHEVQRIAEVIELCGKQAALVTGATPSAHRQTCTSEKPAEQTHGAASGQS
ncbi:MAG TPA: hypothetical protein VF123_18490 [Candidatus Sulfotelmatobacter sp.]